MCYMCIWWEPINKTQQNSRTAKQLKQWRLIREQKAQTTHFYSDIYTKTAKQYLTENVPNSNISSSMVFNRETEMGQAIFFVWPRFNFHHSVLINSNSFININKYHYQTVAIGISHHYGKAITCCRNKKSCCCQSYLRLIWFKHHIKGHEKESSSFF